MFTNKPVNLVQLARLAILPEILGNLCISNHSKLVQLANTEISPENRVLLSQILKYFKLVLFAKHAISPVEPVWWRHNCSKLGIVEKVLRLTVRLLQLLINQTCFNLTRLDKSTSIPVILPVS